MRRAVLALALLLLLAGCGGGDAAEPSEAIPPAEEPAATTTEAATTEEPATTEPATTEAATTEAEPAPEPLPGLPDELAGYDGWTRLNAAPLPRREADPHDGTKNVYASVAAGSGAYPDGALVVKEAFRPGTDYVGLIAMMRKERGAQPDHNDWVWVEWVRDGPQETFRELASGAVCYSCHVQARATDYVFTR